LQFVLRLCDFAWKSQFLAKTVAHAKVKWWMKGFFVVDVVYSMNRKFKLLSELVRGCRAYLKVPFFRAVSSEQK